MAETRVSILITAIDEASSTFRDVLDNSESMASKLNQAADTLGDLGNLASDFTEPLEKGLKKSKDAAIGFEAGMAEVRKTTGLGALETAALGDEIKKLSRSIPQTTGELTEIGVAAGQSGVAVKEIPGYIKDVAEASVALAVSTDDAGLAFGRLTNIYGMANSEIPKLAAAINVLGDSTVASEREILNTIMRTAALSKQANLTAKDSAALAASFVSLGMAPQVAATAINALLGRMTTAEIQSARFQKGLAMIGMSGKELQNMTSENGVQAIFALGNAIDKLDPQARAQAIGLMFGAEHSDNVGIFLDRIELLQGGLSSVADDQQNLNRYHEVFATQVGTAESKMQLLNNSFQELAIEIGTALLPAIKAFADFMTPIINKMTEFAKNHPRIVQLGSALAGVAISLGPLLFGLSAIAKGWSMFSAGIPIVSALSNRFLGINNPISRFVGWLARGNQRLLGMQDAAGGIMPPELGELPKVQQKLPICIEPKICENFSKDLDALAANIDCLPICLCPEYCGEDGKKKGNKPADKPMPKGEALPPAEKAEQEQPATAPAQDKIEPERQDRNLSLPQIAMLVAALGATVVAVQKLTDSNAGLGEKMFSVATAIGAGLAAKSVMADKTPQQEATELGAIQQQNAQQVAATEQAAAQQIAADRLANAQALAAVTAANQAAEIASQDRIAAGKLAAQQASNQLATQQLQAQLAAQRQAGEMQVAATAAQASIMAATRSHIAATEIAAAQQVGAQQVAAAQQVGAQQVAAAQQVGAQQVSTAQQVGAQQIATAQQVAGVQAQAAQQAALEAEAKAKAEAEAEAAASAPPPQEKSGGGGLFKNAAMLAAGALGLGGVAFAVSKVANGLGGAIGGLFNATKTVAGAVGKVGGVVGGALEKSNQVARTIGGTAGGAIGTGIRTFQAGNTAARGIGEIAGTSIGGTIKSLGAINQVAKDSGASIGQALGSAIKGTQSLSQAANTAGSGIMGAFNKAGNTITGSMARVGSVTSNAASNLGGAWAKVQKAASVTQSAAFGGGALPGAASGGGGIASTIGKTVTGATRQAQGLIENIFAGAGKLAASPPNKLIGPVVTSVAGSLGAAALANQSQTAPAPAAPPEVAPAPAPELSAALPANNVVPFTRTGARSTAADGALPSETPSPSEQAASATAKNNIVPLVRSSSASGRAIGEGLAAGIESSRPQAELAAAGLAQSVSSYLPRSPAEKGPLSDLDQTGFGLTQEFIRGIDSNAIQDKFREALTPESKLAELSLNANGGGNGGGNNSFVYSPTNHIQAGGSEDLMRSLERHDRQFIDWLKQTQDRFSRGQY